MSAPSLTRSGRFLIARSLADEICNQVNVNGMRMAANQSNINTEEIYKRNWSRIKHQSSQFANLTTKIISWLVLAKRTLSLEELTDAVAMDPGKCELGEGF